VFQGQTRQKVGQKIPSSVNKRGEQETISEGNRRAEGVAKVVEILLSKLKALSSNPIPEEGKKEGKEGGREREREEEREEKKGRLIL
jgi:hypothetical protein